MAKAGKKSSTPAQPAGRPPDQDLRCRVCRPAAGIQLFAEARFNGGRSPGRTPVDPALLQKMQEELESYLRTTGKKKQSMSVWFVQTRLKDGGLHLSDSAIDKKVVRPVHQKLFPRHAKN
jgi:hypothetical protein